MVCDGGAAETAKSVTKIGNPSASVVLPDVPTIVKKTMPRAAMLLAARVTVDVFVRWFASRTTEVGFNVAVRPGEKKERLKPTVPVKPLSAITVMMKELLFPGATPRSPNGTSHFRQKSGCETTMSPTVVVCVVRPAVPAMVIVNVPRDAVLFALMSMFEGPLPMTGVRSNDAVTPDGRPEALKLMAPEKPLSAVSVTL
jgi:hypothetical protein